MHRAGVRDLELVNKFDNGFAGVAMDAGTTGLAVNAANRRQTGRFWQVETCDGKSHDQPQEVGPGTGRDELLGQGAGALPAARADADLSRPSPTATCAASASSGEHLIRRMVQKDMIVDPDHLSVAARKQALSLLESLSYSGVISSHSWADEESYPRIYNLGGVVTPSDNNSADFVKDWQTIRKYRSPKHFFGFGFGSDLNGFSSAAGKRPNNGSNPVRYPFRAIGGTIVDRQRSGTRTYDVNNDGVSHYGLYPDWVEDLRKVGGQADPHRDGPRRRGLPPDVGARRGHPRPPLPLAARELQPPRPEQRGHRPVAELPAAPRRPARPAQRPGVALVRGRAQEPPREDAGRVHPLAKVGPGGHHRQRPPRRARRPGHALAAPARQGPLDRPRPLRAPGRGRRQLVYKVRRGKVRFVALASRGVSKNRRTLRNYLRLAGLR